jgi:DNA-binding CsgD family transcriptional regulator
MTPTSTHGSPSLTAHFYGEHQLEVAVDPRRYGLPDLVADLLDARDARERENLVRERLSRMGFDWFAYATVCHDADGTPHQQLLDTYAHAGWKRRYLAERYQEVDPRWHATACDGLPLLWEIQEIRARVRQGDSGRRGQRFIEELGDCGLRSGIYFRLAAAKPRRHQAVLSFTSGAPHRYWITDAVVAQALALGAAMHEFMSHHVRRPAPVRSLSDVLQQEILQCLDAGKTNKEIARQLAISLHAVDYHLRQLRRQFRVRNRTQLVLAARQ